MYWKYAWRLDRGSSGYTVFTVRGGSSPHPQLARPIVLTSRRSRSYEGEGYQKHGLAVVGEMKGCTSYRNFETFLSIKPSGLLGQQTRHFF
jgi:hypothetical protein